MEDDYTNNRSRRSSEEDKLQRLWQQLKDLSEVQDQSRNQQVPAFFNDDSRHFSQSSFINTNHILNESVDCYEIVQSQTVFEKTRPQCLKDSNSIREPPGQLKYQQLNNYKYSQFSPSNSNKHLSNTNYQLEKVTSGKNKHQSGINDERLEEINQRLLSDNKKLFDQCIKLRKSLLIYQNKEQIKSNSHTKSQKNEDTNLLRSSNQKLNQQLQTTIRRQQAKIQQLLSQNTILTEKLEQKQIQSQNQKRQFSEALRIRQHNIKQQLQSQIQSKYDKKIISMHNLLNLRQKKLTDQNLSLYQAEQTLVQMKSQLKDEKNKRQRLELEIKQYRNQLQNLKRQLDMKSNCNSTSSKENALSIKQTIEEQCPYSFVNYQKQSRANSIKSTSISSNTSYNEKSDCFSNNERRSHQNVSLENSIKDKQRQITNMKIVHEAQVKKYKIMIKQFQLQLLEQRKIKK